MARTLIIGGGIAGLSTAWHLATAPGASADEIVLVEREPAVARQATAKNASILRTLTGHPGSDALAWASLPFFRQSPPGFGERPLVDRRGLLLGADAGAPAERLSAAARAYAELAGEAAIRELDPRELRKRAAHVSEHPAVLFAVAHNGQLDVQRLAQGFERGARAAGVGFQLGTGVASIDVDDQQRVRGVVLSDGCRLPADRVVLASGAWAGKLAHPLGSQIQIVPRRRHLLVTDELPSVDPNAPVVWHSGRSFYSRPSAGGLMLCACDETVVDPDRCSSDRLERERILKLAPLHAPATRGAGVQSFWCGLRTFTADHDFLIGPDPSVAGLFWCAALGGHGVSTAPEVGRLTALALCEADSEAWQAHAPARFR